MAIMDAIDIGDIAADEASKIGINPDLYRKVVLSGENSGLNKIDTGATNPSSGASGPAQVLPATWQGLIKNGSLPPNSDPSDARTNIRAGALVLKEQLKRSGGNEAAAVAGYNGGNKANDAVARGEAPPTEEGRKYLGRLGLSPQTPWLAGSNSSNDYGTTPDPTVVSSTPDTGGLPLANVKTRGAPGEKETAYQGLQAVMEQNRQMTEKLKQALLGTGETFTAASKATAAAGDAAADYATTAGQIQTAELLQRAQIANTFHLSVTDPDSDIVALQKRRQEAQIKMDGLRPVIDKEDQVQIWDDPLRWIANQFTLPTLKTAYNAALRDRQDAVGAMAVTQERAAAQIAVDPAMTVDLVAKEATAKAAQLKLTALAQAAELAGRSSEYMAKAIQSDIVFNNHSWDQTQALGKMFMETQQYRDINAKQDAAEEAMAGTIGALNVKLISIGRPAVSLTELKMMPKAKADAMIDWGKSGTLGNGPGEAMANIRNFGSDAETFKKDPALYSFLVNLTKSPDYTQAVAAHQADPKFQHMGYAEKREALVQEVYDKQLEAVLTSKGNNDVADNSKLPAFNPYRLVHLNAMSTPGLKDNLFVQDMPAIIASSTDKKTVNDKDMLLSYLGKVQADPKNIAKYSSALADYYNQATETQWKNGGAMMTGYPRFQGYGVTDPFGTKKPINVTDRTQLESWAMRKMSSDLSNVHNTWGFNGQDTNSPLRLPPMN